MTVITNAGGLALTRRPRASVDVYAFTLAGEPLRWAGFAAALLERAEARALLTRALQDAEHAAYFWECAPWRGPDDPAFEFVLVPTTALAGVRARPDAFEEHYDERPVARFDSLRKDARLVSPAPSDDRESGLHLASFMRGAPADRIDALWVAVGEEITAWRRADRGALWLSTSGLGVPWLHVRLDSRPKYYTHADYR